MTGRILRGWGSHGADELREVEDLGLEHLLDQRLLLCFNVRLGGHGQLDDGASRPAGARRMQRRPQGDGGPEGQACGRSGG